LEILVSRGKKEKERKKEMKQSEETFHFVLAKI
jgi:hypothetical protein